MRSLRGRLTLGVGLVLAAVLFAFGTVVSSFQEQDARDALDDRLKRTAELSTATARAAVQEEVPASDRRLDAVLEATRTSLRLRLGRTTLLQTGTDPPRLPAPKAGLRTVSSGGERYRTYATTLDDPGLGGLALLEVTAPLAGLERRQRDLDRKLLLLGALALLVSGLGVFAAANLVLRPLGRLRAVASSIAQDENLDRRVPQDGGPAELRSMAASFNAMLGRLGRSAADRERALAATRRFAADAGHELRTPLTSVLTTLSSLRRHPDLPPERRDALLDDALGEHRRLVGLLDGLQALARGDASAVEEADVDLVDLADAAAVGFGGRHPDAELETDLPDGPVLVRGWEPGLRLVLDNLLENAARHGRDGRASVRVRLSVSEGAAICVEDDGPGVPEGERDKVFEPFGRASGTDAPGSGLGLALVAQQVRQHGGTVQLGASERLGGAAVAVRLSPASGRS